MKKKFHRRVLLSFIVLLLVVVLTSCGKSIINPAYGHLCRWKLCPYKGITKDMWDQKVYEYVGERHTDAYHIDILHLKYPKDDYDELEDKLFKQ